MEHINYRVVIQLLKTKLRQRKISYQELADGLDIPLSTLKKWFSAKDGSFSRLTKICKIIDIPMNLLLKEIEDQNVRTVTMSKELQNAFMKDLTLFKVFWGLCYERLSNDEVMERFSLPEKDLKRILLKLDRLKLIVLDVGDKVKVPKLRPIHWNFSGPFMKMLEKDWVNGILQDTAGPELHFFQLLDESEVEFFQDLRKLEEKYAQRTILDLARNRSKVKKFRYLRVLAEGSFYS